MTNFVRNIWLPLPNDNNMWNFGRSELLLPFSRNLRVLSDIKVGWPSESLDFQWSREFHWVGEGGANSIPNLYSITTGQLHLVTGHFCWNKAQLLNNKSLVQEIIGEIYFQWPNHRKWKSNFRDPCNYYCSTHKDITVKSVVRSASSFDRALVTIGFILLCVSQPVKLPCVDWMSQGHG